MTYETIIGLEIHIRPKTKTKMFCGCDNVVEDNATPNSAICPICLGHPGTLPVVNKTAVELGTMMALALNCKIPAESKFDRKNYFYPDLGKNYQISMYDRPIGVGGFVDVDVDGVSRKIGITRLHLEEDAAKLIHSSDGTLIDFNRGGAPLMEIVTEPVIRSPQEAKAFLQELRLLARYLGVSDADMEKGQLRCDANISLRPVELDESEPKLYPKTEIKNLNSFKAVEKALEFEITRQTELWEEKNPPMTLTTRGWDDTAQKTYEQRTKEEAHDYRYFPEPDIAPLKFGMNVPKGSDVFDVAVLTARLPETPSAKRKRFVEEFGLSASDARLIVEHKAASNFTEEVISELRAWLNDTEGSEEKGEKLWDAQKKELAKLVAGWLTSKLYKLLNDAGISVHECKITPENFAELIVMIFKEQINSATGQKVLEEMFKTGGDPSNIVKERGLTQESDEGKILEAVQVVISGNASVVADYKSGKLNALQFLAGQVMKATKGKANPQIVQKLLKDKLG
ncbi:Asp-tRNA(Asn)/Glu-tRNA(Gln) amidotransferase subunit GatB [Candidatus Uhrbacteria bacterium]|nr:Asp-tRNA(Asn)/Glu-tRNA(Gln) amidotransferase subunit GatB [Candidatus Uhrbacteria bacterium]